MGDSLRFIVIPIVYYNEDASEHGHKFLRDDHVKHAQQTSQLDEVSDILNRSVYRSDPYYSLLSLGAEHRASSINNPMPAFGDSLKSFTHD